MDLYDIINHKQGKLKGSMAEPDFPYIGELVHHVSIVNLYNIPIMKRIAVVSKEVRADDYVLHLYYQGVRLFGTRIKKDRPIIFESYQILNLLAYEVHEGKRA